MTDHYNTPTRPRARKRHRCDPCWHFIEVGEVYVVQTGFVDGTAVRARYHVECWDALSEEAPLFEYTRGELPPPDRAKKEIT